MSDPQDNASDEIVEVAGVPDASMLLSLLGTRVRVLHPPRSHETEGASGGDLDCAVEGLDRSWSLRLPTPWRLVQCLHYDTNGWYWVVERDGDFLALDTLEDPAGLGKYGFPTQLAFVESRRALQGVRAGYLTSKRLLKEILSPDEWTHIGSLAGEDQHAFRSTLEAIFGRSLTEDLAEAVAKGVPPSDEIRRKAKAARRFRRLRNPWRAGQITMRVVGRLVGRLSHPTGLTVVIAGPDGVGKSTIAAMLPEVAGGAFRRTMHLHWRPQVLPRAGALVGSAPGDPTEPHARPPHDKLTSAGVLLYYWLDFFVGSWIKLIPTRLRSGLIVLERGWWDMAVDPRRYRMNVPSTVVKVLGRLLPAPDLVLVLEAPPETLASRKGELSLEEASRQAGLWHEVLPSSIRRRHIDATKPLHEVLAVAREEIFGLLEARALRRLDAGWVGLPQRTSPRWTLARGSRKAASASVGIYQPVTLKGRLGWKTARVAARLGAFRLLPRGDAPPAQVRAAIAPYLPAGGTASVLRANHPGRFLALIISREGTCVSVAKVATDGSGRTQLKKEAAALTKMQSLLTGSLTCPEVLEFNDGMLLLQAVEWEPRSRPWLLPSEVAGELGALFRATASGDGDLGVAHGDCAPWNLLKASSGWVLVDWESSRSDAPPFFDLFHYLVQSHVLLGRPRAEVLLDGINGTPGWIAEAIGAYAEGAGLPLDSAGGYFPIYLNESARDLAPSTPEGDAGLRARERLLVATAR